MTTAQKMLSAEGTEKAMIAIDWELAREPESWEAWIAKADILFLNNRYDESLECCEMSILLNSQNALSWNTKGNVLFKLKRYDEAMECYHRAIEILWTTK
jgi:tetratricopeptide (TPR) repeat protein